MKSTFLKSVCHLQPSRDDDATAQAAPGNIKRNNGRVARSRKSRIQLAALAQRDAEREDFTASIAAIGSGSDSEDESSSRHTWQRPRSLQPFGDGWRVPHIQPTTPMEEKMSAAGMADQERVAIENTYQNRLSVRHMFSYLMLFERSRRP